AIALSAVSATPTPAALDVFDPPIIKPDAHTVWHAGTQHNSMTFYICRDTSTAPAQITNPIGSVILRTLNSILNISSGFSILDGSHRIQLPADLPTRKDYMIVLFGDSGNTSPSFTI
ncbi:hypothetical protein M422DRAFT_102442, partial [Sphaerobolus stellatus SS14]